MVRKLNKVYRMACIAIGKKRVNIILLAAGLACFYVGYRNDFDIQKTMAYIIQAVHAWMNTAGLSVH